jgi:hypothetical protein
MDPFKSTANSSSNKGPCVNYTIVSDIHLFHASKGGDTMPTAEEAADLAAPEFSFGAPVKRPAEEPAEGEAQPKRQVVDELPTYEEATSLMDDQTLAELATAAEEAQT